MGKSWNESMFNRYGHRYGWVFSIVFAPFPFLVLIHCNLSQNCNYLKCVPFGSGPLVPNNFPLFGFGFPVQYILLQTKLTRKKLTGSLQIKFVKCKISLTTVFFVHGNANIQVHIWYGFCLNIFVAGLSLKLT